MYLETSLMKVRLYREIRNLSQEEVSTKGYQYAKYKNDEQIDEILKREDIESEDACPRAVYFAALKVYNKDGSFL